jgi:hypothetical protein
MVHVSDLRFKYPWPPREKWNDPIAWWHLNRPYTWYDYVQWYNPRLALLGPQAEAYQLQLISLLFERRLTRTTTAHALRIQDEFQTYLNDEFPHHLFHLRKFEFVFEGQQVIFRYEDLPPRWPYATRRRHVMTSS